MKLIIKNNKLKRQKNNENKLLHEVTKYTNEYEILMKLLLYILQKLQCEKITQIDIHYTLFYIKKWIYKEYETYPTELKKTITNLINYFYELQNKNIKINFIKTTNVNEYRYYQKEADYAIFNELYKSDKCLVKMFCGTGKSLLMLNAYSICKPANKLIVYVFPTLSLIQQFYNDYLIQKYDDNALFKISSDSGSTTDDDKIQEFLKTDIQQKFICVTYASYFRVLNNLNENKIDICVYDEAHHAISAGNQQNIFTKSKKINKQIFFTATPKNDNGIVMVKKKDGENSMCGELVYEYSYIKGLNDGYLNAFDLRIDFLSKDTVYSIYESIARTILTTNNNRVLTFSKDVNGDRYTSVKNFVNQKLFKKTFNKIVKEEFSDLEDTYKKITFVGLDATINGTDRSKMLRQFDNTPDNEIFIISSCETIGEGVDTKRANMCVMLDPKSSYTKIIQNIGRIVRKPDVDQQNSTILLPCWVNKDDYLECKDDKKKRDAVIRKDLQKDGNFHVILNVICALKQEDPELFEMCLRYPKQFTKSEIKNNLKNHNYEIDDNIKEQDLISTVSYLLDTEEIKFDDEFMEECTNEEEKLEHISKNNKVCIEVHSQSIKNPIQTYNKKSTNIIRMYKCGKDDDKMSDKMSDKDSINCDKSIKSIDDKSSIDDKESVDMIDTENLYQPIVKINNKKKKNKNKKNKTISKPKRVNFNIHTNKDIEILWSIKNIHDFTKNISCIIDYEIKDYRVTTCYEIIAYVEKNGKSNIKKHKNVISTLCKEKCSNGSYMGDIWNKCKTELRCERYPYNLLLENPELKAEYEEYKKDRNIRKIKRKNIPKLSDEDKQNEFKNFVIYSKRIPTQREKILFSDGDDMGIYWKDYKGRRKGENEFHKKLLEIPILNDDYNKSLKNEQPIDTITSTNLSYSKITVSQLKKLCDKYSIDRHHKDIKKDLFKKVLDHLTSLESISPKSTLSDESPKKEKCGLIRKKLTKLQYSNNTDKSDSDSDKSDKSDSNKIKLMKPLSEFST